MEIPNKPGQRKGAKKIADAGGDIYYVYGSPAKEKRTIRFKTGNDKKAIKTLAWQALRPAGRMRGRPGMVCPETSGTHGQTAR